MLQREAWGNGIVHQKGKGQKDLDLDVQIFSSVQEGYSNEVVEGKVREKCTVHQGKWRKRDRGLLYHNNIKSTVPIPMSMAFELSPRVMGQGGSSG